MSRSRKTTVAPLFEKARRGFEGSLQRKRTRLADFEHRLGIQILRSRVANKDFTIVASNCWGATVYQELGILYRTPFVGLYLFAPCYIQLLSHLRFYVESPLRFIETSRYPAVNRERTKNPYPIGLLGNDVEIQFLHHQDEIKAYEKWNRRISRICWDRLFFSFSDRDLATPSLLNQFDKMPFKSKVCFTAQPYPTIRSSVWLSEFHDQPCVGDLVAHRGVCKKHFDVGDWLNGGRGRMGLLGRLTYLLSR